MQLFQQPFDANTVKPNEAFDALPAGWYNGRIVGSEQKATKDNQSGYLQFEIEVIDGEHKGRKVFDRLNLWNNGEKSEKVREIAHRQLSAYCHATGVFILQDSNQLHGIPFKMKLAVRMQEGFDPSNDVKAVKHIQDVASPAPSSAPPLPFGQNPALPPQPAAPAFAPSTPPQTLPAFQPAPQQPAPWAPPAALVPQQPAPAAGPVPPWRR